jgi:hypothetical protein
MRTPKETAEAIVNNEASASELLDEIRPLAQAYLDLLAAWETYEG